ncbi:nucleoside hydrolase [Sphingopyxis sp. SE2]|uniref:nucleoside hydrolase n=1 Tax=Sphingopyxis sp. SE2 TaxID=1586240 RepID=UPI0028C20D17|nr:nucleoside hydrolase [Sphingopyxis sp. SE2]MDT7531613.1 nucleoside hydrolase [Sphingopyxis sp. SE2]
MTALPVIIDCDPGQDDAINLLMAFARPDRFDILGVTAVAGNVPLNLTQRNIRLLCALAGRPDIPVYAGCDRPLIREPITAHQVHGPEGIDGMTVGAPSVPLQPQHAVDFIIATLEAADDDGVTLVPTGPLTNIAAALSKVPAIASKISQIVLMGGAMREAGNFTPSAEFNILVDPHAAEVVFGCGRPIVAFGLDVTHRLLGLPDRLERIRALGNPVADAAYGMLSFFNRFDSAKYGSEGAPLHDPCTIAWLLRPELFQLKPCNISIETTSPLTVGHTAVDFWHVTTKPHNARWAFEVDSEGFFDLLTDCLSRYGGRGQDM